MKKVVLSENQIKNLVDSLITEQQSNKVIFSVDFQNAFASGQYNFNPQYEKIVNDNVEKIDQFIKGKNIENFKLVISSGESQVPNPKGFEEKGSLAKKRAEVLKGYLDSVLPKVLDIKPVVEISQPIIGNTPWVAGQDNKDDQKYTQEQFVKVNVVLTSNEPIKPERRVSVEDTVKMNNPQGNASGVGFVMSISELQFDPNYGYKKLGHHYELEIFPSATDYWKSTVGNNLQALEVAIDKYKKMYKTDIVRRGTTKENNYSPEGVAQMKRQNLFNPSK